MSGAPTFVLLVLLGAVVVVVLAAKESRRYCWNPGSHKHCASAWPSGLKVRSGDNHTQTPHLEAPLFEGRHGAEFRNICPPSRGFVQTALFDYAYGRGMRRASTDQTLAAFTQDVRLPQFGIGPQ